MGRRTRSTSTKTLRPISTGKCSFQPFLRLFLVLKIILTESINYIRSGWNNDSNPQEQSPTNSQQIPLGSGPPPGLGNFQPNRAFGGRGNSNNNWNPPVQGQQLQQAPPATLMTNPPPNMNLPPPKMVRSDCLKWRLESDGEFVLGTVGGNQDDEREAVLLSRNYS